MPGCGGGEQDEPGVSAGNVPVEQAFDFAGKQLARTLAEVDDPARFPRFVNDENIWETTDAAAWSSGFFPATVSGTSIVPRAVVPPLGATPVPTSPLGSAGALVLAPPITSAPNFGPITISLAFPVVTPGSPNLTPPSP